jgi:glycosyltransferase involved in cell wall biosynthesis
MRILWLSYYYLPHVGGGTWPSYYLSQVLSNRGHTVELIVPNVNFTLSISPELSKNVESKNLSKVYRVPSFPLPRMLAPVLCFFPIFLQGLKRGKNSDVIVCQFHPHHLVTFTAVLLGRILNRPVVARACDVYRNMGSSSNSSMERFVRVLNVFNESLIKRLSVFLICCSEYKEILLARNKSYYDKIQLLVNGFDLTDFHNLPSKDDVRKSLGLTSENKMILFVGRFSGEEYGAKVLLKAFALLLQKAPGAVLFLVGDVLSNDLLKLIDSLGITESVKVYGAMPHKDILQFIVGSDVCIGPLMATQTIPLKVLEYMVLNKPVVSGNGSISKDLNPETNFILCSPMPEEISEAIWKALCDQRLNKSYGNSVPEKFSWQTVSEEMEQILSSVVKSSR